MFRLIVGVLPFAVRVNVQHKCVCRGGRRGGVVVVFFATIATGSWGSQGC